MSQYVNLSKFCRDEVLWRFLTETDLDLTQKPDDMTWKAYYYQQALYKADELLTNGAKDNDINKIKAGLYFGATRYNEAMGEAASGVTKK